MINSISFRLSALSVLFIGFLSNLQSQVILEDFIDPLEQTSAYSILLSKGEKPQVGYYPMGFIHGDERRVVLAGYNLREAVSIANAVWSGRSFPAPLFPRNASDYRFFNLAWSSIALSGALQWAQGTGQTSLKSSIYGTISPAIAPNGKPYSKGAGTSCNLYDPLTRTALFDYLRQHVKAWSDPQTALGRNTVFWGLDNEWEGAPDYSAQARSAFAVWLEKEYGGEISGLNCAWNSSYQSFQDAANGQLPSADEYQSNKGKFLDWWTFQTKHFINTLAEMSQTMHEADPLKRGVVHKSTQQTIEMPGANRKRIFDPAEFADLMRPISNGIYGIDIYGAGDRQIYETNFIYQCIRPENRQPGYGVMLCEANNHGGPGKQFAATHWRLLANGVKAINNFTVGFSGAKHDWKLFGFLNDETGKLKDKMFYAVRWASMVHRTESFWSECIPAENMPRVAMLMPRRDVLLADSSSRNPTVGIWAYPENHRWMLFRWLREQGYWVDVIPWTKLKSSYLKSYQGLFLIGAEHLSKEECAIVDEYVRSGGTLVVDTRAGYYDEHHRKTAALDQLIGVKIPEPTGSLLKTEIESDHLLMEASGRVNVSPVNAKTVFVDAGKKPSVFLNTHGRGRVLYFSFMLGSLTPSQKNTAKESGMGQYLANGPTADGEDYATYEQEFVFGQWLARLLSSAQLKPAYELVEVIPNRLEQLRVEAPVVDAKGNCAVVVTTRGTTDESVLPPTTIRLPMPERVGGAAWWAAAEGNELQPIQAAFKEHGYAEINLPTIRSGGVLYFFKKADPLLGVRRIASSQRSADGETALIPPGKSFQVVAQIVNVDSKPLSSGTLKLNAMNGWSIVPSDQKTAALQPGEQREYTFTVTSESDERKLEPDWLYPLILRWNDGEKDRAVITTHVELILDAERMPLLLSDNKEYPETNPYLRKTGAVYQYLSQVSDDLVQDKKGNVKKALTNGFGCTNGGRYSKPEESAYYANCSGKTVDVVFDLQKVHEVMRVVVSPLASSERRLQKVRILTSDEGSHYVSQVEMTSAPEHNEVRIPVKAKARFVRIQGDWIDESGGALDEIEIWGR